MTVLEMQPAFQSTLQWEKSQYVRCYAWGHAWDEYGNSDWRPTMGQTFMVLRCIRCSTERREAYNLYGEIETRHYHWPAGYRFSKGEGKPTKGEFRLMALPEATQRARQRAARKRSKK